MPANKATNTRSDTILAAVAELAREKLDWNGDIELSMGLIDDLQLDSIRLLTLVVEVEDHFRICLDEDDETGINTVGDLVSLIEFKMAST